ncbi:hypothetical protein [Rhabdaerophilum sp. SD176]|uniref:hypothetical protein n=1 Tax=Rhabdaerophilum sp. SD176 TaxID=2983548 RepID=UPI0024E01679|nr:hypothetical protein [Rhabdaerophilum sp. SD176]
MSAFDPKSQAANQHYDDIDRHHWSDHFYQLAKYAAARYPLHPKVTHGELRSLNYHHLLNVGDLALTIAARRARTAKFGSGPAEDFLARVILPDHRFDDAVNPPEMHECWLDSPILVVDLGPCEEQRLAPDSFALHANLDYAEFLQPVAYNIDLSQAVVIDGYQRLRQAERRARESGKPAMMSYISISMWETRRYIPTLAMGERRKQTAEQMRSLFVKDDANPPTGTLHRYLPAARQHAQRAPGLRFDNQNRQKLVIGAIHAPISQGRPKPDAVLSRLFLELRLEFRRACVLRNQLKEAWLKSGRPALPSPTMGLINIGEGQSFAPILYDRITDPVILPIEGAALKDVRLVSKKDLKDRTKIDRRHYVEKIGVMSCDAFLDQITSKTYVEGGFQDNEDFEETCKTIFQMATQEAGIAGGVGLLEKSIQTAISLFKIYFRVKCICYPAAREILALKQSEASFANKNSQASKDYERAFTRLVTGVVGSITDIHVKDVFAHSATIGYNLCDFYPKHSVVADIVEALVDVLAQAKDKSGQASKTRRAYASAVTFACYGVSHYVEQPDRFLAWCDFAHQAQLHGVSFDKATEIYGKTYRDMFPPEFTRNGLRLSEEQIMGSVM